MTRNVALLVTVGGAYFLAGKLGLSLAVVHPSVSPVWPPTGIAIAAFLVLGWWIWPAILVGAFLFNLTTEGTLLTSLAIGVGNTLEGFAGAWLTARFANGRRAFETPGTILRFVGLAVLLAPTISATIGVSSLTLAGFAPRAQVLQLWGTWWLGDAAGALVVAPAIVIWANYPYSRWSAAKIAEAWSFAALAFVAGLLVFTTSFSLAYVIIPFLLWPALRFGSREAATVALGFSVMAVVGTMYGHGPFQLGNPNLSLLGLQGFMAVVTLVALVLAAVVEQRSVAQRLVRESRDELRERLRQLAESQARFTAFMKELPGLAWIKDLSGRYVYCNDNFAASYDIPPGEVLGRTDDDFVPPEDAAEYRAADQEAVRTRAVVQNVRRQPVHGEIQLSVVHKFPILDDRGDVALVGGVAVDITALKRLEERLRLFLEASPDAAVIIDTEGRIVRVNEETERMFGYGRTELVGQPIEMLIPETLRERHVVHRSRYMKDPRARPMGLDLHPMGRHQDGTEFPVEISLNPFQTDQGLLVSSTIRNVSERLKIAKEREELAHLRAMDEFRNQFINIASHELNTPLTPIKAQIYLLRKEGTRLPPGAYRKAVDILSRNFERISRLVHDLLDAARLQSEHLSIERKDTDLARLLSEAVESFQEAAREHNIRLSVQTPGPVHLEIDATRISQVIYNLLANALKFTPAEGHVLAECRLTDKETIVSVHDTGMGLDAEQLAQLFRPFAQIHGASATDHTGAGLGLFISHALVQLHDGRIWAESGGPGKGATFSFSLPLAPATAPPPAAPTLKSVAPQNA